jgi:hypothetical protein
MNNLILLVIICLTCAISVYVGTTKLGMVENNRTTKKAVVIPDIGRIELLNGCGAEGAANKVADYLRSNNFDVKYVGNADTWNYPFTMVITRGKDDSIANQVAKILKTDKLVKIRDNDNSFDVTVVIGPDYGEKIQ